MDRDTAGGEVTIEINKIYQGDALKIIKTIPDNFIDTIITSPPYYGLRDYGNPEQIGLEEKPEIYITKIVEIFNELRRTLKPSGTGWLNIGDSYYNNGHRGLMGIPWRVALALQADGWYLMQDIIWHKKNGMPESVKNRCTKAHEYIFLLTKSDKYYFDYKSIMEKAAYDGRKQEKMRGGAKYSGEIVIPGNKSHNFADRAHNRWEIDKNGEHICRKRSVWSISNEPLKEKHFATFPRKLLYPMLKAGGPEGSIVLDPFMGSGTTAIAAKEQNRNYIGIELNPEYIKLAESRIRKEVGLL